jgi:hypothetical protein
MSVTALPYLYRIRARWAPNAKNKNYERYRPWRCLALFSVSFSFSGSSPPLCCFAEDEARQLSSAARCRLIGCFLQVQLLCLLSFSSVCVCVCVCSKRERERARARPLGRASEPAHDCVCAKERAQAHAFALMHACKIGIDAHLHARTHLFFHAQRIPMLALGLLALF